MAFCTQCGVALTEGDIHTCAQAKDNSGFNTSGSAVDPGILLHLLKKPDAGLSLVPDKEYVYGLIGMGGSLLGFFLWGLALKRNMINSIVGKVSSVTGDMDFFGGLVKEGMKGAGSKAPIATNMLILGLISLVVLFGSLWLAGRWKGTDKLGWKETVTYLGSMQLASGVVFIVAAIAAFVSVSFSLLLVAICLLITLILTCLMALDVYGVGREHRLAFVIASMTVYAVIVLTASGVLLRDAVASILF
ncbi:hypothetical protein GCM10020370_60130 [Paenibacillus hodogayensis]